jgi:nucleoside-diphosphate-sugar epimerase
VSKILVTGANGFIGRALVARLKSHLFDVTAIGATEGDICDQNTLERLIQTDYLHVFHLAGKTYVPDSWVNPVAFYQTNVLGTVNVLEFCRRCGLSMTYISAYVYGHPDKLPIKECSSLRPSNPYALSKKIAEEVCEFYSLVHGLSVTTIRPFNVYGIGQNENFLIPSIIQQTLHASTIVVKDLVPKRDYVYLEDLLKALVATINSSKGYNVYNIGSGHSLSVQEVIDCVQDVAAVQKEIICESVERPNELMDVVADISKAANELQWYPKYSFRQGIEEIINSGIKKQIT